MISALDRREVGYSLKELCTMTLPHNLPEFRLRLAAMSVRSSLACRGEPVSVPATSGIKRSRQPLLGGKEDSLQCPVVSNLGIRSCRVSCDTSGVRFVVWGLCIGSGRGRHSCTCNV